MRVGEPVLQVKGQLTRGLESMVSLLFQTFQANRRQTRWDIGGHRDRSGRIAVFNLIQHRLVFVPGKWAFRSEQFIEDDTETPNVTAAVHSMQVASRLFGRHVEQRAGNLALELVLRLFVDGETEVGDVGAILCVQEDVTRLQVEVHESLLMCVTDRFGNRDHHFGDLGVGQPCPFREV